MDSNSDGIRDRRGKAFSLEFIVIAGNAPTQSLAQTLQAEWKKIGLDIKLVLLDGATAIQRVVTGDYDAAYVAWSLDAAPDPFGLFHSSSVPPRGQNVVFYSNPEADRLIEQGRRELDPTKRQAVYRRFHEIAASDQPSHGSSSHPRNGASTGASGGSKRAEPDSSRGLRANSDGGSTRRCHESAAAKHFAIFCETLCKSTETLRLCDSATLSLLPRASPPTKR